MKKCVLVLLTFVPIIVGYIVNHLLVLPVIGVGLYFVLPLLTTAFWFYLGRQYAHSTWKTAPAILIGNATGVISLLVYLWLFLLENAETRNLSLAAASQMFSMSTPLYLFGRFAVLFDYTGRTTYVTQQVISVLYMITVFSVAIFWEKKHFKM